MISLQQWQEDGGVSLDEKTLKYVFAVFSVSIAASLQVAAWYFGHNGAVFAFVTLIIGGVIGSIFGFSVNKAPVNIIKSTEK